MTDTEATTKSLHYKMPCGDCKHIKKTEHPCNEGFYMKCAVELPALPMWFTTPLDTQSWRTPKQCFGPFVKNARILDCLLFESAGATDDRYRNKSA